MKIIVLTLLGVSLLARAALAQRPAPPVSRHPMISVHNYKHPDKAAQARREQAGGGVPVTAPTPDQVNLANYKRQSVPARPAGGLTLPHTPDTNLANRNYKQTRAAPVAPNPVQTATRKPTMDGDTASGN